MIAALNGEIIAKNLNSLVLEVGGVGYEIFATPRDIDAGQIGEKTRFFIFHSVKETAEELFGFRELRAKNLFELLLAVHGVGPKAALAILALDIPENLAAAIATGDAKFVARASGIGKKTAERVVAELREKVAKTVSLGQNSDNDISRNLANFSPDDPATEALIALGFSAQDAAAALKNVDAKLPLEERIKLALKYS